MAVWVIIIIFVVLAAFLYWLSNCSSWTGNDYALLQALFASAALLYFGWDLFSPSNWIWKVIDILIIILIIYMYWATAKGCRLWSQWQARI